MRKVNPRKAAGPDGVAGPESSLEFLTSLCLRRLSHPAFNFPSLLCCQKIHRGQWHSYKS